MNDRFVERRRFYRHPSNVPVECRVQSHADCDQHEMRDVSHGGIAFVSDQAYELGAVVELRYPSLAYPEAVRGTIVWTAALRDDEAGRYINGLSFRDETDHYHGRIVEQICHIEAYRRKQAEEYGREISSREAADEWITMNAADFPD